MTVTATMIASETEETRPGLVRRLGLRFVFSYFVIYAFPFPFGLLPWTEKLGELAQDLWTPIVRWAGRDILGIGYAIHAEANGSGDRTYDYVLLFVQLSLAIVAACAWTLVARRARRDRTPVEWLCLYVRLYVGTIMLSYGFAKIVEGQFPRPSSLQLIKTYGESSPMHLLWTFMGYSRPYTMFAGFMEAIPGALLFVRRTTWLGALLLLTVMGNIVLLNFCYDVPVKLFSSHLWLMCLFLAWPGLERLVSVLILHRPVARPVARRFFSSRRARRLGSALYVVLVLALTWQQVTDELERQSERTNLTAEAKGVRQAFTVEEMSVDGRTIPADDPARWSRITIRKQGIRIYWSSGTSELYRSAADIVGPMTLDLSLWTDDKRTRRGLLELSPDGEAYVVEGQLEGKKIHARLARIDVPNSLLMTRGFHWINEVPFNR